MYADDIVLFAPLAKGLQRIIIVSYTYGYDNDIRPIFNRANHNYCFLIHWTMDIWRIFGHIITDNLCDEPDIKAN